ncbi:MAG: hypothetical protein ACYC1U_10130 [Candidatus Aquicultorales bacterium]
MSPTEEPKEERIEGRETEEAVDETAPEKDPERKAERDLLDWVLIGIIGCIIVVIIFLLWPRGGGGEPQETPFPVRKVQPGRPGYLGAYNGGLEHLKRKEYGQAVLDLEDAVELKNDYFPAVQKLAEARALAELDVMVRRGILSDKAAQLRAPTGYLPDNFERKAFELDSISYRQASTAQAGAKVVWWGIVVSVEDDGFTLENKKFRQAFFVRSSDPPALHSVVKVYGTLDGMKTASPGATTWFQVPVVEPRFVDPVAGG